MAHTPRRAGACFGEKCLEDRGCSLFSTRAGSEWQDGRRETLWCECARSEDGWSSHRVILWLSAGRLDIVRYQDRLYAMCSEHVAGETGACAINGILPYLYCTGTSMQLRQRHVDCTTKMQKGCNEMVNSFDQERRPHIMYDICIYKKRVTGATDQVAACPAAPSMTTP